MKKKIELWQLLIILFVFCSIVLAIFFIYVNKSYGNKTGSSETKNDISVALISAIVTLGVAWIGLYKRDDKIAEIVRQSISLDLRRFNMIKSIVSELFIRTKAERFLILMSYNGSEYFNFATALYEQHKDNNQVVLSLGATSKYVKVEIDDTYRSMLKEVESKGFMRIDTENYKDGLLKDIYHLEKVTYSNIYFIKREKEYPSKGKDLFLFCSIATHSGNKFSEDDETAFRIFTYQLKNLTADDFTKIII